MDLLAFAANLMYVAAYLTKDLLRLRLLSLCAGCCLTAYFGLQPKPLLTVVGWNLVFVGLNLLQVVRLLRDRRAGPARRRGRRPAARSRDGRDAARARVRWSVLATTRPA